MKWTTILLLFITYGMACLAAGTHSQHQSAMVVSVKPHETPSNYVGDNPADAPLVAQDDGYDIGIRLDCTMYSLRYQSAIDYLPSVFAPEHEVSVYTQKHFMYVDVAGGRDVRLEINNRRRVNSCMTD